ncbi:MAG: hypothetical protein SP1CHLAM54_04000 [Chlamydiia bacterium]|nr:hypothetical protein [Chlamydiia bacterium]MCH9615315.1 hypothetical protein [Chlamydiia bacterium]MCH9628363.1 hypothetical protein [Chlamydiia bacterium]
MKKTLLFLLCAASVWASGPSLEANLAYFRPATKAIREIYGNGLLSYQVKADGSVWQNIRMWGSVNYAHGSGHSVGGGDKTSITYVPLTLGVKWLQPFQIGCVENAVSFGIGPRYYFVLIKNDGEDVQKKQHENGLGFALEAAYRVFVTRSFYFDLFSDYGFRKLGFDSDKNYIESSAIQAGGFSIGGGIGWRF